MAAPFVPKPPRGRIPISDADRAAARAGMDGEKTKQASEAAAVPNQPVAPAATEPAAPAAAPTQPAAPVAAELVAPVVEPAPDVATTPAAEAAPNVATAPAAAPVTTEPTPEPAATEPTPEPAAVATAPAPTKPAPQPTATAAPGRRSRKPTVATEQAAEPAAVRSVKIRESVWGDIKLLLALLPKEENTPRNIQAYVEAAHQHYEAHLRKQGKLPPK